MDTVNTHLKLYLILLVLVAVTVVGFLWWQTTRQSNEIPEGLGSELYQNQNTTSPAENLPIANPLENKPDSNPLTGTNPYSDIKTNPFK
ncbi:MAG: hypothetical protein Q7R44_00605 [bacterium]|nr:hypothetical protein [bacterium]